MPAGVFAVVIAAEALVWRPVELVIIVNNGLGSGTGFFGAGQILMLGSV